MWLLLMVVVLHLVLAMGLFGQFASSVQTTTTSWTPLLWAPRSLDHLNAVRILQLMLAGDRMVVMGALIGALASVAPSSTSSHHQPGASSRRCVSARALASTRAVAAHLAVRSSK